MTRWMPWVLFVLGVVGPEPWWMLFKLLGWAPLMQEYVWV